MIARWDLTDTQAEAILNMRLSAVPKLPESENRKGSDGTSTEKAQIEALLASEAHQWKTVRWEVENVRRKFDPEVNKTLGPRRTSFAQAPTHDVGEVHQALVEREP